MMMAKNGISKSTYIIKASIKIGSSLAQLNRGLYEWRVGSHDLHQLDT